MSKKIVIKLGGSAISTENNLFDFSYLNRFRQTLSPFIAEGYKFLVVLGGGYTMRMYRDKAKEAGVNNNEQLHWIGTTVNVLHGFLAKAYFSDISDEQVVSYEDYYDDSPIEIEKSFKFGGGGRPGHSGDVDALLAAEKIGTDQVFSLKNVDAVYSADPKQDLNAKPVSNLTWNGYLEIIGHKTEHEPGGNYPVDPVASRMANEKGITFNIVGAQNLVEFAKALKGETFKGTVIK